jgi:hypothetical protein
MWVCQGQILFGEAGRFYLHIHTQLVLLSFKDLKRLDCLLYILSSCLQAGYEYVNKTYQPPQIKFVPDRDTVSCNQVDNKVETSSEVNKIKVVPDRDTVSCNRVDNKVETSSEVNKIKVVPDRDFV